MTMAESAVEDAAAAPPGPAKPPPPSCTNNNTLAATANRNHRAARKRRRLNQVLDDLNAHKSLPSEGETLPMRFDATSFASEEEEDVFGSPRSSSRSASENALQPISKRLKSERLDTTIEEETHGASHLPYQPYYPHNQNHNNYQDSQSRRLHPADNLQHQNHQNHRPASLNQASNLEGLQSNALHHNHPHHHQNPSTYHHRQAQKYRNCACPNWVNQPLSAILLPSPTSPLTPPTPLTPLTPVSLTPLTPVSPSSYTFEQYFNTKYMPSSEIGRKRSHSDSDVPGREPRPPSSVSSIATNSQHTPSSRSVENDPTSPQDCPLDLSMKNLVLAHNSINNNTTSNNNNNNHNNYNNTPGGNNNNNNNNNNNTSSQNNNSNRPSALHLLPSAHVTRGSVSVPVVRGDVASPTTKETVAERYNLEVSPVVEEMPPGADVAYVCPVCGQMFSLHDRLAKHMASRHRRQGPKDATAKAYRCEVCKRSFARSDMLTRHMRLHTGVKPYTCKTCNQVFSRSDHLSTHQRTHTGEKPYKCPQCVYAACRRDMITRHLRTHAKITDGQLTKSESGSLVSATGNGTSESPSYGLDPIPSAVKIE